MNKKFALLALFAALAALCLAAINLNNSMNLIEKKE